MGTLPTAKQRPPGYRINHNLIRSHAYFGVEFGSSGENASRADHNSVANPDKLRHLGRVGDIYELLSGDT